MKPVDNDQLFFELIDFLLEYLMFEAADISLGYIQDIHSNQYLMSKAKIRLLQKKYGETTAALDELLQKTPNNVEAWVMRGHAFFLANNLFDSEESYIRAIRLNQSISDSRLQERLGNIYAKRKSWNDAKTVYLKCCKEKTSTIAWLYLGWSCIKLGDLNMAEDAISQSNMIDHAFPDTFGLMTVLCLTTGQERLIQANHSFNEALKLDITND